MWTGTRPMRRFTTPIPAPSPAAHPRSNGGGLRENTHGAARLYRCPRGRERLCEQMDLTPAQMLAYLQTRGVAHRRRQPMGEREHCSGMTKPAPAAHAGTSRALRKRSSTPKRRRRHLPRAYIYSALAPPSHPGPTISALPAAASAHAIQQSGQRNQPPRTQRLIEAIQATAGGDGVSGEPVEEIPATRAAKVKSYILSILRKSNQRNFPGDRHGAIILIP